MGSLLSSFQRIVGVKEFLHRVHLRHNLDVDGDITVKGNLNVRGSYSGDAAGRTVPVSDSTVIDLGTKKKVPRRSVTGVWTAAGTDTVNLTAYVPRGAKAAELMIGATDATAGIGVGVRRTGGFTSEDAVYTQVSSVPCYMVCDAVLDANRTFDLYKTGELDVVSMFLTAYYM